MLFEVQKRAAQSLLQSICGSTRGGSKIRAPANAEASVVVSVVAYYVMEWQVVAWLHRYHRQVLLADSGSLAKEEVSEKIFLVAVKCDSCIASDPIDAAVETMMTGR